MLTRTQIKKVARLMEQTSGVPIRYEIPTNVWVSVSEMMPPVGLDCFVFVRRTETFYLQRCIDNGLHRPTWADGFNKGQADEITHWMIVKTPKSS
jgi:hypothetical protein